mmetsp:Transcript_126912/g.206401  ORF Transcript_126912/g.206401 Transcript_126912/m.206401 type:complete len:251 (+) Transcript_126912:67-819(+)
MARRRKFDIDDDDSLFSRSLVRDNLSKVSEGSNEDGSINSSTYFSAASGSHRSPNTQGGPAAVGDRAFLTVAGAVRLPRSERSPSSDASQSKDSGGSRPASSTPREDSAEILRKTVKAFVESGVRGRRIEALRRDGRAQPVVFRLSRQVDAFEITPEGGLTAHTVNLTEVACVYTGDDARAQSDLATHLPGLNRHCAVVDLHDGRCLTFRFPSEGGHGVATVEAETFAQCMQIFVNEVQLEAARSKPRIS